MLFFVFAAGEAYGGYSASSAPINAPLHTTENPPCIFCNDKGEYFVIDSMPEGYRVQKALKGTSGNSHENPRSISRFI